MFKNIKEGTFNVVTAARYFILDQPIQASNRKLVDILNLQNVTEENRVLREYVSSIARNQAYTENLEQENADLQAMLDFKNSNQGLDLLASKVIFRDSESWNNIIKIDVGSNDGVLVNDAVIVSEGLVGRVESVTPTSSIVRLLISPELSSKVAVKILLEEGSVEAIIDSYDASEKAFNIILLDTNDHIALGDRIVTSGAGGLIPGGLLVGEISLLEDSINQLGSKIQVKPYAKFSGFEFVYVVRGGSDE
ncbi:MAG: rod shape-determining protein MreC [Erysipelothrix sp.]|nr:rod shape-determining protein MreC [Erysipelothrix sp.]